VRSDRHDLRGQRCEVLFPMDKHLKKLPNPARIGSTLKPMYRITYARYAGRLKLSVPSRTGRVGAPDSKT
jgi:hypothetical protein